MCNSKCFKCMCVPAVIGKVLLVVGGLNWGLVGLGMLMGKMDTWNLVAMIFGKMPTLEAIIYLLVGVSAIMALIGCRCAKCMSSCATCAAPEMNKPM